MNVAPGTVIAAHLHPGQTEASFDVSLDGLRVHDEAHDCRIMWPPIRDECGIDVATGRDRLTATFLEHTPAEWLFMVDADMGFAPDTVDRLLAAADPVERPIVGALAFGMKRAELTDENGWHFNLQPTVYTFADVAGDVGFVSIKDYPRDQLCQVDGTGAACLLIHRSVLERIGGRWWQQITYTDAGDRFSEDLSFCVRAADVDAKVHVHTGVKTSHKKPMYLDEWAFDNWPTISPPMPPVIVTGTGRCGTQYVADVLAALDVPSDHERSFSVVGYDRRPGVEVAVSWMAAPLLTDDTNATIVHLVRDPLAVVNSLVGLEFFDPAGAPAQLHTDYLAFVHSHLDGLPDDPTLAAMAFVVRWNELAGLHASERVRVESFPWGRLLKAWGHRRTKAEIVDALEDVGEHVNHRPRGSFTWATLPAGSERDALAAMAIEYGYEVDL